MLKTKVKASTINNLTDARYFAAREVDWLGFPLDPGQQQLDPTQVKAMIEWVDGVEPVGEFGFTPPDEIREICQYIGLKTVQTGMFTTLADIEKLQGLTVIKEVVMETGTSPSELEDHLDAYAGACDAFLLSFAAAGISWEDLKQGTVFSAGFIRTLTGRFRILLDLECPAGALDEMLDTLQPYGLGLRGGEEEKTGFKSFDELDELLDVLEMNEPA